MNLAHVATLGIAVLMASSIAANCETVSVSYTEMQSGDQNGRSYRIPRTFDATLDSDNTINVNGRSTYSSGSRADTSSIKAGTEVTSPGGIRTRIRVLGANRVVAETSYPTFVRRIAVTTSKAACSASVTFSKEAGAKNYEMPEVGTGKPLYFQRVSAQQVRCTVK